MTRSAYELAAVASAAVPGLAITSIMSIEDEPGYESALLRDDNGKTWRVRSALNLEHSSHLDTELQTIQAFTPSIRTALPFTVPSVIGSLKQENTKTYVYSHLTGESLDVSLIEQGSQSLNNRKYAENIGQALAALHNVPVQAVEAVGLPHYSSQEFRRRTLKELDQAAATGKIPNSLLQRWESILENTSLWHYTPRVVHGDLREDNILVDDQSVTSIVNWGELHGGDPAEDFAWLSPLGNPTFTDTLLGEYEKHLNNTPDPHLEERAAFHSEFALAQWLIEGLVTSDQQTINEAQQMLNDLAFDIEQVEAESKMRKAQADQETREQARQERALAASDEAFDVEKENKKASEQNNSNPEHSRFLAESDNRLAEKNLPPEPDKVPSSPQRPPRSSAGSQDGDVQLTPKPENRNHIPRNDAGRSNS